MSIDPLDWLAAAFGADRTLLVRKLLQLVGTWLVGWLLIRLVNLVARRIEMAADDGDDSTLTAAEKRGQTIAQLIRSVGGALVLLGVIVSSLNLFIDIGPLLAGVGILSLAVSFGAQSLVKDFIAGFFILFENQFVVGDVIQVGDKSGAVERMTLRMVALRDSRGAIHVIPNGSITSVTNLTRGWSRAVIDVSIGYATDVDRALAVVRDELAGFRADPAWQARLEGVSEVLGIEGLEESGVTIRTLIRTAPGSQWDASREFRRRLKNRLDREGIEIPFPQRTVYLRQVPPPEAKIRADSSARQDP
jgi:small conductance mechanosensitive channel